MTDVRCIEGPRKDEVLDLDVDLLTADYPRKYEPVPLNDVATVGGIYWLHPGATVPRVAIWHSG